MLIIHLSLLYNSARLTFLLWSHGFQLSNKCQIKIKIVWFWPIAQRKYQEEPKGIVRSVAKLSSIVCPTSVFGAWSLLLASFAGSQICMAKLANKHRTSNICLPNMNCLKNLVVAKRASKDGILNHVRQTMLVSFARSLWSFWQYLLLSENNICLIDFGFKG